MCRFWSNPEDLGAPEGTENLAQGHDTYSLKFTIMIIDNMAYNFDSKKQDYEVGVTWNEIMKCVLPHCVPECTEGQIVRAIQEKFRQIPETRKSLLKSQDWSIRQNQLKTDSMKDIIVQLKALGILIPSEKKRSLTDNSNYWTLSKYGDNVMNKLCAIPKHIERDFI